MSWLSAKSVRVVCISALVMVLGTASSAQRTAGTQPQAVTPASMKAQMLTLPLAFEPNRGQADKPVQFLSRGAAYTLYLTPAESVFVLSGKDNQTDVLRLRLAGAQSKVHVEGLDQLPGRTNYFIGNVPSKWRTDVPNFAKVRYRAVYPGIDLLYYGNQTQLEHDFIVAPGADPTRIAMELRGAKSVSVDGQGNLIASTDGGKLQLNRPFVYQESGGKRIQIDGEYKLLANHRVGFALGNYDRTKELVIDPVLNFSTYLGGAGTTNSARAVAVDGSNNIYVTGDTNSLAFPGAGVTSLGPRGGASDIYIAKLDATGSTLSYVTIIGGGGTDAAKAIAVDGTGITYVTGSSRSNNLPTTTNTASTVVSFDTSQGGQQDAFVFKLNAAGDALIWTTYLGGSANPNPDLEVGNGIAVANGFIYVVGTTDSDTSFPKSAGAADTTQAGNSEAFLSVFDPSQTTAANQLVYSSFLGGGGDDNGNAVAIVNANPVTTVIVGGDTTSATTLPGVAGKLQTTNGGGIDGFIAVFDPTQSGAGSLVGATYLGGTGTDTVLGVAVDGTGVYATGSTASDSFPGTAGSTIQAARGGVADAFAVKLNTALTATTWGTYLGGTGADIGNAIAVDGSNDVFVVGQTASSGFPTNNAFDATFNTADDGFVVKILNTGASRTYSTFLGGSGSDQIFGVALDSAGLPVIAGATTSTNFNLSASAPQSFSTTGTAQGFVAKLAANDVTLSAALAFNPAPSVTPAALAVGAPADFTFVVENADATNAATALTFDAAVPYSATTFTIETAGNNGAARTAGGVTTITTTAAHGLTVGEVVRIQGVTNASFNGTYTVATVPTGSTFTYAQPAALGAATSGSGTVRAALLKVNTATATGGSCGFNGNGVTCVVPTVAATASTTVTVNATPTTSATALLNIQVTGNAASAEQGSNATPGLITAPMGGVVDLSINLGASSVTPGTYTQGTSTTVTYVVQIDNLVDNDATGVTFTGTMPANFSFTSAVTASAVGTCSFSAPTVTCTGMTIPKSSTNPNNKDTVTITGSFTAAPSNPTLPSTFSTSNVVDSDGTNNTNKVININYVGPQSDLQVLNLTAPAGPLHPNDPLVYSVDYQNNGPADATGIVVTFTVDATFTATVLPAGCLQTGGTGQPVICTVAGTVIGDGAPHNIAFAGPAPLANNVPTNTINISVGIASAAVDDPDPTNNNLPNPGPTSTIITRTTDLDLTALQPANGTTVTATQTITYSANIANLAGQDQAQNVQVVFTLTPNFTNFNGGANCVITNLGAGTVTCTTPTLNSGQNTNFSFTAQPPATVPAANSPSGNITVSAAVVNPSASVDGATGAKSIAANTITVERKSDLQMVAFSDNSPVRKIAGALVYSAQFRNTATVGFGDTANNIQVVITIANTDVTFSGTTTFTGGCVQAATTITCTENNTLGSGVSLTRTVTVTPAVTIPTNVNNTTFNASAQVLSTSVVDDGAAGAPGANNSFGPITSTIQRVANLGLAGVSATASVGPSGTISYSGGITNSGPDQAEGVTLTITVPNQPANPTLTGFTLNGAPQPACVFQNPTGSTVDVVCNVPALANGASTNFVVSMTPPANFIPSGNSFANFTGAVSLTGAVVDASPNTAGPFITQVQAQTDLSVTIVSTPATTVNLSTTLQYDVNVSNAGGGSDASNVVVTIPLPSNPAAATYTVDPLSLPGICTGTTTLTCTIPSLNNGATTSFNFTGNANLPSNQQSLAMNVQATVSSASVVDQNATNDNNTDTVTVQRQSDLFMANVDATPLPTGTLNADFIVTQDTQVRYDITIGNNGPDDAGTTVISVPLPASNITLNNATVVAPATGSCGMAANIATCTITSGVPTGTFVTVQVLGTAIPPAGSSGTISVTPTVSSSGSIDNVGANNGNITKVVNMLRNGDLAVTVTGPGTPTIVDGGITQNITYTVSVKNNGPSDASNIGVTDTAPSNFAFSGTSLPGGTSCGALGGQSLTCTIGSLASGQTAVLLLTALPALPASVAFTNLTNSVLINPGAINDPDPSNNSDVSSDTFRGAADVTVSVTPTPLPQNANAGAGEVLAGDDIRYTILVGNNGPHPAALLTLTDIIPPGTVPVSISSVAFNCPGTNQCTLSGLAQGSSATVLVRVTVPPAAVTSNSTVFTNNANVTQYNAASIAANATDQDNSNNDINTPVTARQTADLGVTHNAVTPSVLFNNPGTFSVTVSNNSNLNDATGVQLVYALNVQPLNSVADATVNFAPSQGSCVKSGVGTVGANVTCNFGTIAVGASANVTINLTPTLPGSITGAPTVTSTTIDPATADNAAVGAVIISGNTPPGAPVSVAPADPATGTPSPVLTVTFPNVTIGGSTLVTVTASGSGLPAGHQFGSAGSAFFNLSTTAVHDDPVLVCMNVAGNTFQKPERKRLFFNGVDITIPTNFSNSLICGRINLFPSTGVAIPLVVAEPTNHPPVADGTAGTTPSAGKGLTGTSVTLDASNSDDQDSNPCILIVNGAPTERICRDKDSFALVWTGNFVDGTTKSVTCSGAFGAFSSSGSCAQLNVAVPFGAQNFSLQVTDPLGASSSDTNIPLTFNGAGSGGTNSTVTINKGQSANFQFPLTFTTTTQLTVSVTPATPSIQCTATPNPLTLVAPALTGTVTVTVGCSTQGAVFANAQPAPVQGGANPSPLVAGFVGMAGLPLVGMVLLPATTRKRKHLRILAMIGLVFVMGIFMSACGGGGGGFGGAPQQQSSGTPAGTYTVTVSSNPALPAGSLPTFTLVVQ